MNVNGNRIGREWSRKKIKNDARPESNTKALKLRKLLSGKWHGIKKTNRIKKGIQKMCVCVYGGEGV